MILGLNLNKTHHQVIAGFTRPLLLLLPTLAEARKHSTIELRLNMEIESHDSVPAKPLIKVAFQLGTESYTIDANKGTTVLEQLVSMKEESMRILKEFITKHNVSDDVVDDVVESLSDEEGEDPLLKCSVKSKKTKI